LIAASIRGGEQWVHLNSTDTVTVDDGHPHVAFLAP